MSGRLISVTLVSLALIALGGCVGHKAPPPDDVVLLVPAGPDRVEVWQEIVKDFADTTKISVTVQGVPSGSCGDALDRAIAQGKPPDIVLVESTRFPEFVSKGALQPLDSYLKTDTDIQPGDYYPAAWQSYQYQGSTYGLPNEFDVLAVACDLNQLELASVPMPKDGWTWDDYLKTAQDLTADRDGNGRPDVWGTTICPWWQVFVWQNGGELVDNLEAPRRSTLSTPAAQEALQFLTDLQAKHHVAPPPALTQGDERVKAFKGGQVALIYTPRNDIPTLAKTESRMDTVPLPRGKVAANLGSGSGYCLVKGAPHADKAWRLMSFLSGVDGQKLVLGAGFTTPARPALVASEYFAGPGISIQGPGAFATGLKVMRPMPFTPRYAAISAIWNEELKALWSGQATVAEVTKRIDERVDKVLAEAQPTTAWLLPLSNSPAL
jgi:multiple sugar transport system substrate-binding protein